MTSATGAADAAQPGCIHAPERDLLPLSEGAAYFALRAGVPIVPGAIAGTSWLRFGGRVTVTVGERSPSRAARHARPWMP